MFKKLICMVVAGTILMTVFSGCQKKNDIKGGGEKVKISMSFWEPSTGKEFETALNEIAKSYQVLHPNVEIEFMSQPVSGYQEWIKSRFAANNAPVIESNHGTLIAEQYKNGLVIDMKNALEAKSAYADDIWKNTFVDGKLEQATDYQAPWYVAIPFFGLGVGYFYNIDLYEKLGLSVPKTWDEFMKNCEVIDKNTINPIALMAQKDDALVWLNWYLSNGLYGNALLGDKEINLNGDCNIDLAELAYAISTGKFDLSQGKYKDIQLKLWDNIEKYAKYAKNSTGLDEAGAKAQFLSSKAAHIMSGSWDIQTFMKNDNTKSFKIGAFELPKFTKDNSPTAGPNPVIGGVQPVALTKSAAKSDAIKAAAIDFLQYLFSQEQYKMFVEKTIQIPTVKNLDVDPIFKAFQGGERPINSAFALKSTKSGTTPNDVLMMLLAGKSFNRDEMLKKLMDNYKMYINEYAESNNTSAADKFGVDKIMEKGGKYEASN